MRLKEPLYGVKMAGMHFLIHIILAIAMIVVQSNLDNGTLPPESYHCPPRSKEPEPPHALENL